MSSMFANAGDRLTGAGARRLWGIVAILTFVAAPAVSHAQLIEPWSPEFEEVLRSSIDRKTLDLAAETLDLTPDQEHLLESLHADYRILFEAFVAEAAPIKAELDRALVGHAPDSPEAVALRLEREERLCAVADQQAHMDDAFMGAIQGMLDDAQAQNWTMFRFRLHHRRALPFVEFCEESVDVAAIVEGLSDGARDAIDSTALIRWRTAYAAAMAQRLSELEQSAIELSRRRERDRREKYRVNPRTGKVYEGVADNPAIERAIIKRWEDIDQRHRDVRNINRSFRATMTELLPGPLQVQFELECAEAAVPDLFQIDEAKLTAATFERIARLEDISEEQRQSLNLLIEQRAPAVLQASNQVIRARDELREAKLTRVDDAGEAKRRIAQAEVAVDESARRWARVHEQHRLAVMALLTEAQIEVVTQEPPPATPPVERGE